MKAMLKAIPLNMTHVEGMVVCYQLNEECYNGGIVDTDKYHNKENLPAVFVHISTFNNCSALRRLSELNKIVCEYEYKDGTIQQVPLREEDYEMAIDKIGTEVDFEICVANSASGGVYPLNKCKLVG